MSVIFEGIEMPTACCFVDGEHSAFAHFEFCKFYNICEKRDTIKTNCKPSDCPVEALEQESTTKNDLGADCISRAEAIKCLECDFDITGKENMKTVVNYINSAHDKIVNLPRVKQEPFKPMVEIDLYSVIKQKYIEREVLDKIRAEIKGMTPTYHNPDWSITDLVPISEVLKRVDKYKSETENT